MDEIAEVTETTSSVFGITTSDVLINVAALAAGFGITMGAFYVAKRIRASKAQKALDKTTDTD